MPRKKKVSEADRPLNYIDSKDKGDDEFDPKQPLQIRYSLFGKERETVECGGALTAVLKPDSEGKIAVLSSVMGAPNAEMLIKMLFALSEHVREVLIKLDKEKAPKSVAPLLDLDSKEVEARLALSQAAFSKSHH